MQWDVFCRVIDNFGDIGVCWRLAADLASRGEQVRLWVDDASALAWMAPHGARGVEVLPWPAQADSPEPGDVVIEAFGCELPAGFIARMAARPDPPAWVNLEYLSAEDYVERSHGLASPQMSGPGAGLRKRFFYPGFTQATGGLLREPGLGAAQESFDAPAWLAARGFERRAGEQVLSLFCYDNPAVAPLLEDLAGRAAPSLLLATPGHATRAAAAWCGTAPSTGRITQAGALRIGWLPALTQTGYDHLLWGCDLNFVRGEDSFVRAQWAGRPFVWQIYPQHDGVHEIKLEAFLSRMLAGAPAPLAGEVRRLWRAWNGLGEPAQGPGDLQARTAGGTSADTATGAGPPLWAAEAPLRAPWRALAARWREDLLRQTDLCTQLAAFVRQTG